MTEPVTHTLVVPGAVLSYDVRRNHSSTAPVLLLFGSPMSAEGFGTLAGHFADRTVITYDPRGADRSERTDGATESTPDEHAGDLHRLIAALDAGPVDIFASSGGAVNALALVARHPEQVRTLVAHEPPASQELPDREQVLAACVDIRETYLRRGFGPAMAKFIALVSHDGPLPADFARQPAPDPATFGLPTEDDGSRDDPLVGQNIVTCNAYRHDFEALRAAPTRIVIGVGAESGSALAGRAAVAVARRLGLTPVTFPGGHDGFLGGEFGRSGDGEGRHGAGGQGVRPDRGRGDALVAGIEGLAGWFDLPAGARPGRGALVKSIEPGETLTIADVQEPGCFRHLVCTATPTRLRDLVLEAWWDDEPAPSVECPLPDFMGIGHGGTNAFAGDIRSLLLTTAPRFGYNAYFPMPFARRGLLRLRNDGAEPISGIHAQADFHRFQTPVETPLRFHAVWRRANPAYRRAAPLTLLETTGAGYLAGLVYHVHKLDNDDRWTHAGGDHIFLDGLDTAEGVSSEDGRPYYLHGDGGEDYYGGGWGLYPTPGIFAGAHHAHPLPGVKDNRHSWEQHDDGRYSMYRWYVDFPIAFRRSIRVAFGTLANEISATVYWYQAEPHPALPALPAPAARVYATDLSPDEGERPLGAEQEWPLAVLGPFSADAPPPWSPEVAPDLGAVYRTEIGEPYQDVVGPPWPVRWQATRTRHHFVDFQAIHRAKRYLTPLGIKERHLLPVGTGSYACAVIRSPGDCEAVLEVGFEDRAEVWLNRRRVGRLHRPRPQDWGTEELPLRLEAGDNELVLWQTTDRRENWTAWAASLRLRSPHGGPLPGAVAVGDRFGDLLPTLERWREPGPARPDEQGVTPSFL